tara:strand:+ start:359 stop:511 length:153 start_codon:yes stop_codon:yes gene_type:complete
MISIPLPKGTYSKKRSRGWGKERLYRTSKGNEIFTNAPYEKSIRTHRNLK